MASDRPRAPSSTYRLQFNRQFRLSDATRLLSYLGDLGIGDIYASPLLKARAGSLHGYDVTDPHALDPEIGGDVDLAALENGLRSRRMGLLLDIVPNHMAASSENPWWADLLEYGPASPYARYFDIDWASGDPGDGLPRVVLPVLGKTLEEALRDGELRPSLEEGRLTIRYYEQWFPISPATYHFVLPEGAEQAQRESKRPARSPEPSREDHEKLKRRVQDAVAHDPGYRQTVERRLRELHEDPAALTRLQDAQHYRLIHWRETPEALNYRRFFDITDLAAVRVEDPDVFEDTHRLVFSWIERGSVTGLRIDHIDGLYDPQGYLAMLQQRAWPLMKNGAPFYVVVEKILGPDGELPEDWLAAGTSGYEFMNLVNNLFVDPAGLRRLTDTYQRFIGEPEDFRGVARSSKYLVMQDLFAGEMRSLARELRRLAKEGEQTGLTAEDLDRALLETTAALPVYRTYVHEARIAPQDRSYLNHALADAAGRAEPGALSFLRRVLLLENPPKDLEKQARAFVRRWQQFTGPIMAKGVEDTALYRYNRLISMNEVGGDPAEGAVSIQKFHEANHRARDRSPYRLNATSTHDSKRSEDVRARINVLCDIPDEWSRTLSQWSAITEPLKPRFEGRAVPDRREEMLLYQTLVGAWPLSPEEESEFRDRLKAAITKGAREAKVNTSWLEINEGYEQALHEFIDPILDEPSGFLDIFRPFQEKVAFYGAVNSLAQVVLKAAAPGVPDFYRGTDLWDFSLVDPDNRRPVDFEKRVRMLGELQAGVRTEELLSAWTDGRIKLYVTWKSLELRRKYADVFVDGGYTPLYAGGAHPQDVIAFARHLNGRAVIVAVPRRTAGLTPPGVWPVGEEAWQEGALEIPEALGSAWRNAFTDVRVAGRVRLPLREVFAGFPVALLEQLG